MAMIKCPECGNEISDLAIKCPHCGRPIRVNNVHPRVIYQYNAITISHFVTSGIGLLAGIGMIIHAIIRERSDAAGSEVFMSFGILFIIGAILLFITAMIHWKRTH